MRTFLKMAQSYSDEERAEIFNEYAEALDKGIPISEELAERMKDATVGVKDYTYNLNQSLKQLGQSVVSLASDINKGAQGAGAYKNVLRAGVDAVDKWGSKFGQVGQIVAGVIDAGAEVAVQIADQSDAIYKANQEISRSGALGAGGMTEVYENMQKFGYNVGDLDKLTGLLKANSVTLAQFGKGAYEGAQQLADLSSTIMESPLKREFMNMGMSVDDMNKGMTGYIKQQTMLGMSQSMTQDQLRAGAVSYLREMEGLQRVTGQTREAMEAQRASALQIDQFAATVANMNRQAAGSGDKLMDTYNRLMAIDPSGSLAKGMAESLNGYVSNSKEAQQLWMLTNGENLKWGQELKQGKITEAEYVDRVTKAMGKNEDGILRMAQSGVDVSETFGKVATLTEAAGQGEKDNIAIDKKAREATIAAGQGLDKVTASQTDMRLKQLDVTKGLNNMLQAGVVPVTQGMGAIANMLSKIPGMPGTGGLAVSGSAKGATATALDESGAMYGETSAPTPPPKTPAPAAPAAAGEESGHPVSTGGTAPAAAGTPAAPAAPAPPPPPAPLGNLSNEQFDNLAANAKRGSALAGKTYEDYQKNIQVQQAAVQEATQETQATLKKAGASTTSAAMYLTQTLEKYNWSAQSAAKILKGNDASPISKVLTPDQLKSNPDWANFKTIGDLKAWADKQTGGGGYKFGGVSTGPTSGYQTTLHGTEAVVPLPDGKQIPVEMNMDSNGEHEQAVSLLAEQISRMDDMIRVLHNQVSTSKTIAQRVA